MMHEGLNNDRTVLLITKEKFENMKNYFIENNYAASHHTEMGEDVRFAEFTNYKDIILKNDSFTLMIFNDYKQQVSTLITYIEVDIFYQKERKEFTFKSADDFLSSLSLHKKDLSKRNGTVQAIDWIINNV